jgi:hypothetical protein
VADRRRRARLLRVLSARARPPGPCPDDDSLALFLDRRLSPPRTRALEAHLELCAMCRELVFVLAALNPAQ